MVHTSHSRFCAIVQQRTLTKDDAKEVYDNLRQSSEISDENDGLPSPFVRQRAPKQNHEHRWHGAGEGVAHQDERRLGLSSDLHLEIGRVGVVGARNEAIARLEGDVGGGGFRVQRARVDVLRDEWHGAEISEDEKDQRWRDELTARKAGKHAAKAWRVLDAFHRLLLLLLVLLLLL